MEMFTVLLYALYFKICTPANTPATPPNFPDTLALLSRLSATELVACSPSTPLASPPPTSYAAARQVGTSPPSQHVFCWPTPADEWHNSVNFMATSPPVGSPSSELHAQH